MHRLLLLLFLLMSSSTAAVLHPVDFLALQSIRSSLSDLPGSRFLSSWDFTSDPCAFPGVLCSNDRVVSLSLGDPRASSPGLAGRLHPSLGRLSALAELSLVPGRVTGPIPSSLSSLLDLRFLALSRNYLSGEIPTSLSSLRRLRTLDLSFNLLSGSVPASLGDLPELVNVILCHNRLTGAVPRFSSPSLSRLDLKRNLLEGPISSLPSSLQYLSLSSNRLSGPVNRFLAPLGRLSYLDLSMNLFSGPIPGCVFAFPIAVLQLQRNLLSGPVEPTKELAMQTVDLSYNMLWGPISPLLAGARRLYLNSNRFVGKVPEVFVERLMEGRMEVLYVQHNFLTGIGMTAGMVLPARSSVCLEFNCMVVPVVETCPVRSGTAKARPAEQCRNWRG